jgi:hypothetical protein
MTPSNSRKSPRHATNRAGIIIVDGKEQAVILRDASETGVRIRSVGTSKIPDRFRLTVAMEKIDAECVVIWRKGNDVGVTFEGR